MADAKPVSAMVVFFSRYGATEKLALAAGLGALQVQANIRLRRLDALAEPATIEADEQWSANLARMKMDYVVPRDADPEWAEVIFLASPSDSPGEVRDYLNALRKRGFSGKIAAIFLNGHNEAALASLHSAAAAAGFIVVPTGDVQSVDEAQALGRRAAGMVRALKNS